MARTITIGNTPIEFPESSEAPNWAPAVIEFAEAVAEALSGIVGAFDVPVTTLNIDSQNPTSGSTDIPGLAFSTTNVRGAFIRITVQRTTSSASGYEATDIMVVYNPSNSPGQKWEISRATVGDASITFTITDAGQVQFTTTALTGTGHQGLITFTAQALKSTT